MIRPGDLTGHSDFHLFKEGIKPMWEVGGVFLFEFEHVKIGLLHLSFKKTLHCLGRCQ